MPTGIAMAQQVTGGGYDLVITSSTPSMQARRQQQPRRQGAPRLHAGRRPVGVGRRPRSRGNPLEHPPYMVGQGSFPPVDTAFELARKMLPGLEAHRRRRGIRRKPTRACSSKRAARWRRRWASTLLEANVDTTAARHRRDQLAHRAQRAGDLGRRRQHRDRRHQHGDRARPRASRIPVFTILPGAPDRGTLFDAGPGFLRGRAAQSGLIAADVLEGADMTKIPVRDVLDVIPPFLSVNTNVLKGLKEPWQVPADAAGRGDRRGRRDRHAPQGRAAGGHGGTATPRPLTKTVAHQPRAAAAPDRRRRSGARACSTACEKTGWSRAATTSRPSATPRATWRR